ncbi:DNA mismatch repair protein MLH3-like isoform X2 [Solanum dulcamara]|uniref:DNA mismatch repair protein MLH3-like isoform X2 n=1 Tax=Solanum dulcamara TaxID=45834 RepID=UPI00248632EE|nr:DNA mismatch repair protein MLH3-like isoform X2 [Solanum dulcamara]
MEMGSIKRIPEAIWTRGYLVVEELVFNSLEAGANKVSVAIGIGTCYVKVVDSGSSVSRDRLVLMGERYGLHALPQLIGCLTVCVH